MSANNLQNFAKMTHRELYAAFNRAKRNGLNDLATYIKALADLKYAESKNDNSTAQFVKENAEIMNQVKHRAISQATPENVNIVLTSTSGKKA